MRIHKRRLSFADYSAKLEEFYQLRNDDIDFSEQYKAKDFEEWLEEQGQL